MAQDSDRETAHAELHRGNWRAAVEWNRKAQDSAQPGQCGGCIGAGTGTHCCMCGLPR